jgi:hypothetical protein
MEESKNNFDVKLKLYNEKMKKNMYIFEITKCCGYSEIIPVYKNETMFDLFSKISHHFDDIEIKDLFFYTLSAEYIKIPLSNKKISDFINENESVIPDKLITFDSKSIHKVYNKVYIIYLDDGICSCNGNCICNTCNYDTCNYDYINE